MTSPAQTLTGTHGSFDRASAEAPEPTDPGGPSDLAVDAYNALCTAFAENHACGWHKPCGETCGRRAPFGKPLCEDWAERCGSARRERDQYARAWLEANGEVRRLRAQLAHAQSQARGRAAILSGARKGWARVRELRALLARRAA